MSNIVRVGVAVIIMRQNTILLGERIGSHGANTWATPGGHLEFGESVEQCAIREVFEETGLNVSKITKGGEPVLNEPNKCMQWRWCDINNLPSPLFTSLKNYLTTTTLTV